MSASWFISWSMASFNLTTELQRRALWKIHNTLNTAPRLPPTGLMVIPSCSSGKGGLTNILSLTSQKNKSSQLNVHCRCMSFICWVQTVHFFAVSGWRDCVWLWMCHLLCPLDGAIVSYVSKIETQQRGGGSRRLLMKPSKDEGVRYPFNNFRSLSMIHHGLYALVIHIQIIIFHQIISSWFANHHFK